MKNTDPLMGAKLKSFLSRLASKFEKVQIWPKTFFFNKKKNADFHADFESVEKVIKKCTQKKL